MSGWIKIQRKEIESELFLSEPFTSWQAMQYLILIAQHEPYRYYTNKGVIELKRGQLYTSERNLEAKFGWTRSRVRTFFKRLSTNANHNLINKSDIITHPSTNKSTTEMLPELTIHKMPIGSVITINYYDLYNGDNKTKNTKKTISATTTNTTTDTTTDTTTNTTTTTKNEKIEDRRQKIETNPTLSKFQNEFSKIYQKKFNGIIITNQDKESVPLLISKIEQRFRADGRKEWKEIDVINDWSSLLNYVVTSTYWKTKPIWLLADKYELVYNDKVRFQK